MLARKDKKKDNFYRLKIDKVVQPLDATHRIRMLELFLYKNENLISLKVLKCIKYNNSRIKAFKYRKNVYNL
jgi:hypothetical protein